MNIFDLGPMMQDIQESILLGLEPDPAKVNMLVEQGPKVVEEWIDMIDQTEGEATIIWERVDQLKARAEAREKSAARMRTALAGILLQSFNGRIKTPMFTAWAIVREDREPSLWVRR